MRAIVFASCAAAAAATTSHIRAYAVGTYPDFDTYCEENDLHYSGTEKANREKLYNAEMKKIQAQNSKKGAKWKAAVNQFTAMTEKEKMAMTGYMKQTGKGSRGASAPQARSVESLPETVDWRTHQPNVVTAVKDQGSCGSCWAFASTAVMETHIALATGHLIDFSPQQLTSCTPNPDECGGSGGCFGATAQLAFNYTAQAGLSTIWTWPYESGMTKKSMRCSDFEGRNKPIAGVTGYQQLPQNDAEALMHAVTIGPVSVSVAASGWSSYSSGVYDGCSIERPILNHAVVLNGYGIENGVHYWLIRNSWGTGWGEFGYIKLQRFPEEEPCGIDDEPLDGYSCKSNPPEQITACGMCGVLSDSAYPLGAYMGTPPDPDDPALHTTASPSLLAKKAKYAETHAHGGLPEGSDGSAFIQMPLDKEL